MVQLKPLGDYYLSLSSESGAEALPAVFTKVHNDSSERFLDDLVRYRTDVYKILSDEDFEKYYASLAEEANTKGLPPVLTKIREESSNRFLHNLKNYRQDIYKIIDDDTYEVISNGKREILC
ncbi:unnamed protein product [Plutella xylostella]|uniref:(diamondback moth) hypothetical protein n=1 Tax=Plutella xylostella TaxID=51655 RepID=A0A8S4G1L3_PLUXY|nr:unnamed protein product [Plutella xylostella]